MRRRTRPDTVVPSLEAGEAAGNGVNLERPDEALDARGMLSYGDLVNPIGRYRLSDYGGDDYLAIW